MSFCATRKIHLGQAVLIFASSLCVAPSSVFAYTIYNLEVLGRLGGQAPRVAASGNYAYFCIGSQLHITDCAPGGAPTEIARCLLPSDLYDVVVKDGFAYVAGGSAGFYVVHVGVRCDPTDVVFERQETNNLALVLDRMVQVTGPATRAAYWSLYP